MIFYSWIANLYNLCILLHAILYRQDDRLKVFYHYKEGGDI